MDRRSWPWKKKSSDKASEKTGTSADSAGATSLVSVGSQGDQDKPKKPTYIQISVESYDHFTGLEDEVKTLNDQIETLNDVVENLKEKLSSAQLEITNKENIVKQHTKVAEEAVSGWEKADAEALALKHQLESVTLLKLTADDRAAHLDGALKECMRQIRSLKEDHEKKLHETILTKTKQWEKIKLEFEGKISDMDEELLRSSAENSALSRALQERSNMLMKVNEERSQAEAEIEILKNNIQSCEKEINSLKYELHVVSKELDIRNEEKNMSMRSAEVANKQHLEGVKKITKLEAECQRLRGLVRKKLPGPAALAQMKLEVESLGRDYGETRPRRPPGQNPSLDPPPEISLDNVQQCHKENEFLMGRCLVMEEEMKMLKEALAKRNSELQASRNMCAKTMSKLRSFETQLQVPNQQGNSARLNIEMPADGFSSQNGSNPPSLMSMSEDGVDEEGSCAESWATTLVSDLPQLKKGRNLDKAVKAENMNQLELMDDFLEMERLACSTESNGPVSISESLTDMKTENEDRCSVAGIAKAGDLLFEQKTKLDSSSVPIAKKEFPSEKLESDTDKILLSEFHSRISMIFKSESKNTDARKILEDIKGVMHDMQDALPQDSVNCNVEERHSASAILNEKETEDNEESTHSEIALNHENKEENCVDHILDQELAAAIFQVHDFVERVLGKEATDIQDISSDGQDAILKSEFSDSVNKVLCNKMSLGDFLLNLSHVLARVSDLSIKLLGSKGNEGENNSSDCIDKVTLLEKKVVQDDSLRERVPDWGHISHSTSDSEVLGGSFGPGLDLKFSSYKCSLEEFEQLKSKKDNLEMELSSCYQNLEQTKSQLQNTEHLLTELKSQLASCQKSNSLAETQLKCMAESYNTLEKRAQESDGQVNLLHAKLEALDIELEEEKQQRKDALAQCKELEERSQRKESCSTCASSIAEAELKIKKEREIAAATEKLAECQETIFLLGKQLKSLRPSEHTGSPYEREQASEGIVVYEENSPSKLNTTGVYDSPKLDNSETHAVASSVATRVGYESPDIFNSSLSPYDTDPERVMKSPVSSKRPKHRTTKSSSSSSSTTTPEKNSRGIGRFFSTKSKNMQYSSSSLGHQ